MEWVESTKDLDEMDERYSRVPKDIQEANRGSEDEHFDADQTMEALLIELGMFQTLARYKTMRKWYA